MYKLILSLFIVLFSFSSFANTRKLEKVGITISTSGNPFFLTLAKGIESKLKEYNSKIDIILVSAEYDLSKQSSQVDTFVASGTQIIFIQAGDSVAIKPALDKATKKGIVVGAVDVGAGGSSLTIMTDNIQAGEVACEDLAQRINKKGNVIVINGPPTTAVKDRVNGCKKAFSKYSDIKILSDNQVSKGASREGGMQVMQSLLTKFPEIDAVFGLNDPTAIGADLAIKQFKRQGIIISGVDGSPDVIDLIKNGNTNIVSTSAQEPFKMGEMAVENAIKLFNGEKLENNNILLKTKAIHKNNLDEYTPWVH